ncbi:MAG: 50S ribosomal protein L29 [Microscillaceae bacterium]|nr:50S ribosomal protein L29 [Microscillaceae bacterium]
MKNIEIRELSTEELEEKIREEKVVLQKLKFAHAISPIENPMKIQAERKFIARLMTELHARKNKEKQETLN